MAKTGRRQFLKSVAVTAASTSVGCGAEKSALKGDTGATTASPGASATSASGETTAVPSAAMPTNGAPTNGAPPSTAGQTPAPSGTTSADTKSLPPDETDTAAQPSASDDVPSDESRPPTTPALTAPLGVALLGLGKYASERLAPALQLTQHCRLVGIITGTPSKIPEWQSKYAIADKNVYSYETMDQLIDNPDIHVVYVVTPNHVHPQFVIAAARAKKHVWCEKPMAMTSDECRAMIAACKENGVTLAIGYRLQHEPNTQTVISYAETKPFGAITRVDALSGFNGYSANDANVWRLKQEPGGGSLFDMGVYAINAARYTTGEEPSRVVSAKQWTNRPELFTEVDEFTDFELEFPSGVVAVCRSSFGERMDFLEVTCERGSYKLEPFQGYTGVSGGASDGVAFNQSIANQQAKQMDDDALSILEGRPLLVPGEEGLRDVQVLEAIFRSVQTGEPVALG